jgi:acetyl esterase/lipase
MQDGQRALRFVRAHARAWGINPHSVGVMGTSAGGHLASTLGTHWDDVSSVGDSLDRFSFHPDFLILVSPVIDLGKYAHVGSRETLLGPNAPQELIDRFSNQLHVTSATPPTFVVHAVNDRTVPLKNSLMFYQALVDSGVVSSLHVFPQGAHSIALRNNPGSTALWTTLCEQWMEEMNFLDSTR